LFFEGHEFSTLIDPRAAARVMEEHEREQAEVLRLFRQKLAKNAA
jgi:hypothetical protein